GSVLPYGTLCMRLGSIEALVIDTVAAPEIIGIVSEAERRTAHREERTGTGGSGTGGQRHRGIAIAGFILADRTRLGIDEAVEGGHAALFAKIIHPEQAV